MFEQSRGLRRFALIAVLSLIFSSFNAAFLSLGVSPIAVAAGLNVNLDQWANGTATATPSWQNGNLNGNNSSYGEGRTVPFRLALEGLTPGAATSFHINYDWTAGGHKAYDFLDTYTLEPTVVGQQCAAGGGAVSSMCPSLPSPVQTAFQPDSHTSNGRTVNGAIAFAGLAGSRYLTSYGATGVTISVPTYDGADTGNSTADLIVSFTPTTDAAFFLWGGHLAQSIYWDATPNGAGQISGAPWHMRTQSLTVDGVVAGNKNQDRSIQPSALLPGLSITKVADAATVNAGSQIGFVIAITNSGPGDATGVTLSDTLPTGSGISWSVDAAGSDTGCSISSGTLTCSFGGVAQNTSRHVHVISQTTTASCATYNNTATVSATNSVSVTSANASITVANCAAPDVSIAKTGNGPLNAGQTATFTITVTAGGTGSSSNVTVSDTLPAGTWTLGGANAAQCSIAAGALTCNFGTMASGTSKTVTLSRATTGGDCPSISNTATVTATGDTNANNNSASATITVNCQPDVSIAKTGNGPLSAGQTATFTITVSAGGTGSSSNVTVSDTLPAGTWTLGGADAAQCAISTGTLTCNFGTMAAGTSKTVTLSRATTGGDCPSISNTATVTATGDTNTQNNSASATITVNCAPDVSIAKTGSSAISAGGTATFSITVTAGGTGPSSNVTVTDTLPAGTWTLGGADAAQCAISTGTLTCNFGTMAQGSSKSVTLTRTTTAQDCPSISNTATVTATGDTNTQNNSASATITVNCGQITISKHADATPVDAGSTIGFTIAVGNTGAGTATGVVVTDVLPTTAGLSWSIDAAGSDAGCVISSGTLTCNFGDLAADSAAKLVHVTSPTTPASCGTIRNVATVATTNDGSAEAADSLVVNCHPDVSVTKTGNGPLTAGAMATFTIVVSAAGTGDSTNVTLTDTLPAGTWTLAGANAASCTLVGSSLSCNFGTMASGTSKTITLSRTSTGNDCPAPIANTANISATGDSNLANNSSSASISVTCPNIPESPRLTIAKTADASLVTASTQGGTRVGFTITLTNTGGISTTATLTDLPLVGAGPTTPAGNAGTAGLTWTIDAAGSDAGCAITANTLSCNFGTLSAGASKHVHITAAVTARSTAASRNDNCGQRVDNTATATLGNGGTIQSNHATVDIACLPATSAGTLTITKYSDNNGNSAKDSGESNLAGWTFEVKNNATGAVKTVTTDASGSATVADLASGDYTVTEKSCAAPCDITKWTAISYKIGTAAAVKSASGSAQVSISAPDTSIVFGNRPPQLPSTSTHDDNDTRLPAAALLLLAALMVEVLALRMRVPVARRSRR